MDIEGGLAKAHSIRSSLKTEFSWQRVISLNVKEQNSRSGGNYNVLLYKLYKNHHIYRDNKV